MPTPPFTAHVVSHTHWDREWYRAFQEFRWRLVEMMDFLLDLLETNPDYKHFYLDGQTIVLEDYLEIRPENRERLQRLFDSGRLYVGPWYIQPDEFLVSGEATIRNLLLGKRQGAAWGSWEKIGYAPDAFGHISQTPQILRGFGIDNAVLFRGITTDQADSEFRWRSPDGSEVLCIKMPDNTAYSNFFYHFRQTLAAMEKEELNQEQVLREARGLYEESLAQRPNTNSLLWMDGVDHIFPQPRTPQIIALVNEGMKGEVTAIHSTLPEFLAAVRAANPDLKTVTGELRHTNRVWRLQALLADTASSRIHLKQRNHDCETLLERYAEPYAAIASCLGKPYPAAFLAHAWKHLLQNQPHDSICGCSIDQTHKDMLYHFDQCEILGEKITRDSLAHIAAQVNTSAPLSPSSRPDAPVKPLMPDPLCALVVFNPLSWPRTDIVEAIIEIPSRLLPPNGQFTIRGPQADAIPCHVESMQEYHTLNQAHFDIPVGERHERCKVRFPAAVPAFGYRTYFVTLEIPDSFLPPLPYSEDSLEQAVIENAFLKVKLMQDGSITLTDKETGRVLSGGLAFVDSGDLGDGYNYIPPKNDESIPIRTLYHYGTNGNSLWVTYNEKVPLERGSEPGLKDYDLYIATYLQLPPTSRVVNIKAMVYNNDLSNHRLRVLFPTGIKEATHSHAEQAFDVVARPIAVPEGKDWKEPPHGRHPMKTFVDVSDGKVGFALISKGLPQYEVLDDEQRTLALTLLRATGNGVGTPEQQEAGQMPGTHTFEFALYPHAGDWEQGRVWQEAHNFNVPLRAVQTDCHAGTLPRSHSFFTVSSEMLVPTTLKRSEDGSALLFRAFNIGSEPITPQVTPSEVLKLNPPSRVRLDEDPDPDAAETLPPKRIATWRFET